jgi:hypothetical protein
MEQENHKVSRAEFEENLLQKLADPGFADDVRPLLIPDTAFDFQAAADYLLNQLLPMLPGDPWQGKIEPK